MDIGQVHLFTNIYGEVLRSHGGYLIKYIYICFKRCGYGSRVAQQNTISLLYRDREVGSPQCHSHPWPGHKRPKLTLQIALPWLVAVV